MSEQQWPEGLHFLSSNRNQSFSPSFIRSESFIQDSIPGGDVVMSCPTLTKNQRSDFLCDSTVGADGNVPLVGRMADPAITNKLSCSGSVSHRQKNTLLM